MVVLNKIRKKRKESLIYKIMEMVHRRYILARNKSHMVPPLACWLIWSLLRKTRCMILVKRLKRGILICSSVPRALSN
ncbi:hypothetical protein AQUCO_02000053v1 [Aquilegia coerulea]|uniref:Uncharacterized protein n=1 Tax=Aquilegia coerulea TaxID=218851 RepID=A0A2G5DFS9_AQUCA|nr:hypothetical protein AQUCO_02000053v1 [Aquilegia coerulea]